MTIIRNQNKNGVKHTEYSIQKLLVQNFWNGAKYMVPNMYYRLGEMDMFLLRRSGYAEEFEIKTSTSDLCADLKKVCKHKWMKESYEHQDIRLYLAPNKFSYVLGENVSFVENWFPVYVGIYVIDNSGLRCIRPPKFLHKRKLQWHKKIAGSCCYRLLRAYKLRN